MLLMTDRALNSFKGNNTFSLNADAGLTIINYSARGQASVGKGDVIFWADTEGAFAGFRSAPLTSPPMRMRTARTDGRANVSPNAVLNGTVSKARPETAALKAALGEA